MTIDAPPERIYQHVANFRSWRSWSPWEGVDPDLRRTYSGPDTGPGATYAWEGNRKAGAGRMEIVEATEPTRVRIDLHFLKPFKARNETVFTIRPEGSGSRLTWTMTGRKTLVDEDHGDLQVHGRDDRARLRERAGFPEVDRGAVDDDLRPDPRTFDGVAPRKCRCPPLRSPAPGSPGRGDRGRHAARGSGRGRAGECRARRGCADVRPGRALRAAARGRGDGVGRRAQRALHRGARQRGRSRGGRVLPCPRGAAGLRLRRVHVPGRHELRARRRLGAGGRGHRRCRSNGNRGRAPALGAHAALALRPGSPVPQRPPRAGAARRRALPVGGPQPFAVALSARVVRPGRTGGSAAG